MNAEYFDLVQQQDGKTKTVIVRENTDDIIDELKLSINHIKSERDLFKQKFEQAKSDSYKDEELQKMKKQLEEIKEDRYYGFKVSKEEHNAIEEWKSDWFKRKRNGDKYMGAIGGGFEYRFVPTGIGVSGTVVAPDGEEFEFRELS